MVGCDWSSQVDVEIQEGGVGDVSGDVICADKRNEAQFDRGS